MLRRVYGWKLSKKLPLACSKKKLKNFSRRIKRNRKLFHFIRSSCRRTHLNIQMMQINSLTTSLPHLSFQASSAVSQKLRIQRNGRILPDDGKISKLRHVCFRHSTKVYCSERQMQTRIPLNVKKWSFWFGNLSEHSVTDNAQFSLNWLEYLKRFPFYGSWKRL